MGLREDLEDPDPGPLAGYCGDVPEEVACLLLAAAATRDETEGESLLRQAHQQAPDNFAVYLGLYKFHFYRQHFAEAEHWMRAGLAAAAGAAGFPLDAPAANHFTEPLGPAARFYLFSLKALAFTLLRQHRTAEARSYLDQLERFDPQDRVGAELVKAIAAQC